jgi:1-deoxy-D-xylulose-5-phosphate reductoisomerase
MQKIGLLGSTGIIGRKVLELIKDDVAFELVFITGNSNTLLLGEQKRLYNPRYTILTGPTRKDASNDLLYGWDIIIEIIKNKEIDFLFVASSGVECLKAIYEAINNGIKIASANKETLVIAGDILCNFFREKKVTFIPVDSEHCGIFQCLMGQNSRAIEKVTITASGGPFINKSINELDNVTVKETLKHPIWPMGGKITVDSATMMNKALELVEAHYLFNLSATQLDTVIHPQSIIHAIVSFIDGSSIAQLSVPDMTIPIAFALYYPERMCMKKFIMDLSKEKELTFIKMDCERFPLVKIVKEILTYDCNTPIIALEAANEVAVNAFLKEEIKFTTIERIIKKILDMTKPLKLYTINDILLYRNEIIQKTKNIIKRGI